MAYCQKHETMGADLGADSAVVMMAEQAKEEALNARQQADKLRGPTKGLEQPNFPQNINGQVPDEPNVHSDGGVRHPNHSRWHLAGFGTWVPKDSREDIGQATNSQYTFS